MSNTNPEIARELLSHQMFLRRLAIDLVGKDADDLIQDVWQRALERPPHHGRQLRGWLARVTRNLAANRWRGDARRKSREESTADERPTAEELEARLELRKELVSSLDILSAASRETILLRYFEGLTPRDIAKRQGAPEATVKARWRRGLAQLREALDRRHQGDRRAWLAAVAMLEAPAASAMGSGSLILGGVAMGTVTKVSAAIVVAAIIGYFATRTSQDETPTDLAMSPSEAGEVRAESMEADANLSSSDSSLNEAVPRDPLAREATESVAAAKESEVLRVVLVGISEEDAALASVTFYGVHDYDRLPMELGYTRSCTGLTSEFDLSPVLATLESRNEMARGVLDIMVHHPHFFGARVSDIRSHSNGDSIHKVYVKLTRPEYWPEFKLDVLDATTRAHLDNVELRIGPGPWMALWGRNESTAPFADGLRSPITLMGGRDSIEEEHRVAGMALAPAAGEAPSLVELTHRWPPNRGVRVAARAPGYAWGTVAVDVSKGERELLLEPAASLEVHMTNVQLERYAALDVVPMLCVYWIREDGGNQYVHFEQIDDTLASEGFSLEHLKPGGYRVAVELGGGSWTEQPVLAIEEVSIDAGETREVALALEEPPEAPKRGTLSGVVSFPTFGGEEDVRLHVYFQPTQRWRRPDYEFSLADLKQVGGELPSWSFRLEDLPVGMYRIQLMPFLKVWMIDLEEGGAEDLELVLSELAEVLVETVDERTGERVPKSDLYYRFSEPVPGQLQRDLVRANTEEPGQFRFWAAPGTIQFWPKWPNGAERGFGGNSMVLDLLPGFQEVKYEFTPVYALRFEFRVDGTPLPTGPQGMHTKEDIRAIDHDGRVTDGGLQRDMVVEVSAAGLYEINFDRIDADLYHPVPARTVEVRADETTEVIVELRRK